MSVVLVTGCSSGFGKLTAIAFARRGDTVFATMRDPSKDGALRVGAAQAGVSVEVVPLDVTDRASVDAAVAQVLRRSGRIDVLVNNAAYGTHGPVEAYDDDEVLRILDTNVAGVVRTVRAVLPHMRERGSGTIVNVSSLVGRVAAPLGGIYAATKHALEGLSDALYFEAGRFGVRVIIIEPGAFSTSFHDNRHIPRRFGDDSPYAELGQRFAQASDRLPGRGERPGPELVAQTIVEAVYSDAPKRRYAVGPDAEAIIPLHKRLSDEEFEGLMRRTLGIPDGAGSQQG
ncbi:MAG: SDR family oxidoreductase [Dehalococcoidia bacterium]